MLRMKLRTPEKVVSSCPSVSGGAMPPSAARIEELSPALWRGLRRSLTHELTDLPK